ncbi:class I SAM-dependent methyltransferase [Desulfitibacter alkalitolerans]|uniref:class I SAM-dependent methyltransferase n=1 Tax=Desulfitibacter alkalitolerans TaxID=264641 RepID=UPI000487B178|nr:class I SAM-dependent methyltransferase [Desulfitibacter alkalitolerans]
MVTSMDASQTMVKLCQKLTGQACLNLRFHDMDFTEEFDGIWACASLLHVPRSDINEIILKLINAVNRQGEVRECVKDYGMVIVDEAVILGLN